MPNPRVDPASPLLMKHLSGPSALAIRHQRQQRADRLVANGASVGDVARALSISCTTARSLCNGTYETAPDTNGRYTRFELAETCGVTAREIQRWINTGLVSPAHGNNPRWAYYDQQHIDEIQALLDWKANKPKAGGALNA